MIAFAESIASTPSRFYSSFISYSSKDEDFARRVHSRMQMAKLRVWFAPEELSAPGAAGN
jgi:hypothetical protein